MRRENNNPRFIHKMSNLSKFFTAEEVEKMSETTEFNESDEFFHFNEEEGWIESLNEEDIKFYNEGMPKDKILIKAA